MLLYKIPGAPPLASSKSEVLDWLTPDRRQSIFSRLPLSNQSIRQSGLIDKLIKFSVLQEIALSSNSSEEPSFTDQSENTSSYSPFPNPFFIDQSDSDSYNSVSFRAFSWASEKWGDRLDSYYLQRKSSLDQLSFRMLRTTSKDMINELYHRIKAGELDFASAASTYGEGPEAKFGGLYPLQSAEKVPFGLSSLLSNLELNSVSKPLRIKNTFGIVQLIAINSSILDKSTQESLIRELLGLWISTSVSLLSSELQCD